MSLYPGTLHAHTDYSNETLRDCINKVPDLINAAIQLGHKCVAITDHETISSYVKVEKYWKKIKNQYPNFKIIRGNEIYLTRNGLNADNFDKDKDKYFHFILLCKDLEGYHQICELSTRAWLRSYIARRLRRRPTYYQDLKEIVKSNPGHLIASSACLGSQLDKFLLQYMDTNDIEYYNTAKRWCTYIEDIFGKGNFYLELQPSTSKNKEQIFVNKHLIQISYELNIPYIITTDAHYLRPEDAFIHEAFLNAQDGDREVKSFYETTYMMNDEEIRAFLPYLTSEEIEIAYKNIENIIEQCEEFSILKPLEIPILPWRQFRQHSRAEQYHYTELMPELLHFIESPYYADNELVYALIDGIEAHKDLQNQAAYNELNECLHMTWISSEVNKAQWSAYYLNLQRIIDECWNAGTIVLPARGSGGGFLLLYALDIIQVNKLRENTPMENWRFLNPARVSVLDIDFDISGLKRAQVLNHLRQVYGENRVSNVATFRLEKSKSAILTAARGLAIDNDDAQYISSLITTERGQAYTLKQMYYGDDEEDIKPNQTFINEINKFPHLWEVANRIEGLICGMGIHAGGIVFKDKDFTESSALMRAPDGTIITQFELHDLEDVSEIKYDALSVEAADKIQICLELLINAGYIQPKDTLRETYESVLNVYNLERFNTDMWRMVNNHEIISLFQMEKQSGLRGIELTHPHSVDDLSTLNSVIRLMAAEKGTESPLDKYKRFREHPQDWDNEMIRFGLNPKERELLHHQLDVSNGLSIFQEQFMKLVQLPECGGFDLQWADKLRKSIAKKAPAEYEQLQKEYLENIEKKNLSKNLCNYVWNVEIAMNRGYGFNASHTLAYSIVALQEMNLAYKYPIIFWNTANLIVDSAGIKYDDNDEEVGEIEETIDNIIIDNDTDENENEDEEELEEWEIENTISNTTKEDKKKTKNKTVDYGKIATAIGKFKTYNITIAPPDINNSSYSFTPVVESNTILYGLRGITRLGVDKIQEIINHRPYNSLLDFINKVKLNKIQFTNLIKCGAFDSLENKPREQIMHDYLDSITEKKQRLTLQNMQALIDRELIPDEMTFYGKLFSFNKWLKKNKDGLYYDLNDTAIKFISKNFDMDLTTNGNQILQKTWDNLYKKAMDPMREYLKEHKDSMLNALNQSMYDELATKYANGDISHWEMDSLSFYYHNHELEEYKKDFDNFFNLPEEPIIDNQFTTKNGLTITMYKLFTIIGTVINKDKMRNTITLLTPDGVVTVRIYKNQFALYDKQISAKDDDGVKHVLEKSWFTRGTLLRIQGIRRGQEFVPKKYKNSIFPVIMKINKQKDGSLEFIEERMEV